MNQVIKQVNPAASAWHFSLLSDAISKERRVPVLLPSLSDNRNKSQLAQKNFMIRITVDAASVSDLRRVIVSTCGDLMVYMRIKPLDHASKMKFWLCLDKASIDSVIGNIMRTLPQAEFGRVTPLLPA